MEWKMIWDTTSGTLASFGTRSTSVAGIRGFAEKWSNPSIPYTGCHDR